VRPDLELWQVRPLHNFQEVQITVSATGESITACSIFTQEVLAFTQTAPYEVETTQTRPYSFQEYSYLFVLVTGVTCRPHPLLSALPEKNTEYSAF
jgi:hypothetical protein